MAISLPTQYAAKSAIVLGTALLGAIGPAFASDRHHSVRLLVSGQPSGAWISTTENRQALRVRRLRFLESGGRDLRFRRVSFESGQSHGRIGDIIQDNQGFLWLGTHDGLQRYDGYVFRPYRHDPDNSNSLSGTNIYALFKDRAGKLWIGSDKYLDRYDPATETFTHFGLDPGTYEGWVSHITEDRDGILWLSTNHGLTRLDPRTGASARFQHRDDAPQNLSTDLVRGTLEARDGSFWVATSESVDLFDRRSGKVVRHFSLPIRTAAERPHSDVSLCEDRFGKIWVAFTFANGLASIDPKTQELTHYSFGGPQSNSAPLPGVRAIREDSDGNLWLGTASAGLLKLDVERRHFTRCHNDPVDPQSLSSDQIVSLLQDREGNIWVGTTGGGVNWFQPHPLPFTRYRDESGNPNSLESDYTSAIYEDRSGIVWVGSTNCLTRINRKTGQYTFYRKTGGPGELSSTWVISIVEDNSGHLWFGTIDGGLNRFDPRTGEFRPYRHDAFDPYSLTNDTVLSLHVDHSGFLWVGTENGLCRFDPATGRFKAFKAPEDGRVRYRSIAEDSRGNLWLGTLETGLRRLNTATGQFTNYTHSQRANTLSSDQVNFTYIDRSDTVWAGTENGLDVLDRSTGSFVAYYERDGLPSSTVSAILEDDVGNLWVSTSRGLSRFSPRTQTFSNYHVSDGLVGDEFYNYASAYRAPSGEMFFNSYAGVISFFPNQIKEKLIPPPVVITRLLLFGKPAPLSGNSPLRRSISYTDSIRLTHQQSIFSIEFSGLSYVSPQENRYRYYLEGLETDWNDSDSGGRVATYTTLAAGRYVFHVQSRMSRGPWGAETRLRIQVLPPWWQTWWFMVGAAASALVAVWLLFHLRTKKFKRRSAELAVQLQERTLAEQEIKALSERLITAQEEERARVARDLHDDLSQQIAALSIALNTHKGRVRDPDRVKEIQNIIQRVLDLSDQVRKLSHELHPALLQYAELHVALRSFCDEFSSFSKLNVSFSASGSFTDLAERVKLCLYRVTQEALRNAAKYSKADQVRVRLGRTATSVELTVADSGVGFRPTEFRATGGLGLVSMRERVRLVGGTFEYWSEPNRGTVLKVVVPTLKPSSHSETPVITRAD